MLTPQETDALFETLRKAIARGLSIVFISHKLHEVMAIATLYRAAPRKGCRRSRYPQVRRAALAALMVGG